MKLHLGCGKRNFGPDWIHIDGAKFPHIISNDITKLNYTDDSVDLIYSSHTLEYFDRIEVLEILKEWTRVLKPGGILRLAVPDFQSMVKLYLDGYELENFLGPLYGKMDMDETIIYHKTCYDFKSLKALLEKSGFKSVDLFDWKSTEHSHIDDHSQAYIPKMDKVNGTLISLNIEAIKI
jgi:predicted SAM-dependent methyltransferase